MLGKTYFDEVDAIESSKPAMPHLEVQTLKRENVLRALRNEVNPPKPGSGKDAQQCNQKVNFGMIIQLQ